MGEALFLTLSLTGIIFFFLTWINNNIARQVISFLFLIVFTSTLGIYSNAINKITPKYRINDKVLLPNNTWGNVDSVAYKIEGVWYNQKLLKD